MLVDEPAWTIVAQHHLTQHGHVTLLPDHVLGQWICVRHQTGRVLWELDIERPNEVVGVSDGVIIATEQCAVGLMGWSGFDCYALDLDTGKLLWTSHPSGAYGERTRTRYSYPQRYDERGAAAAPRLVEDGMCFCKDGRVLDLISGHERGRLSAEGVKLRASRQPADPANALYRSQFRRQGRNGAGIPIAPGRRLAQREGYDGKFTLHLTGDDGRELWTFDVTRYGYEVPRFSFYGYRLAGGHVYVLASKPLAHAPPKTPGHYQPPPPRFFRLLTVELEGGTLCQDFPIGDNEVSKCQIEDVDARGVLLSTGGGTKPVGSASGNTLRYFERRVDGTSG